MVYGLCHAIHQMIYHTISIELSNGFPGITKAPGCNQAVNQKGMLTGERENSECISGSKTNFRTQNAGMYTRQRVFRRMERA